jgi:hypothetical protein
MEPVRHPGGMKLDILVNPSLKADLISMDKPVISSLFEKYIKDMGAPPDTNHEPTGDQLSAVKQLITSNHAPYVDFALFGPHQHRFLKKLTLNCQRVVSELGSGSPPSSQAPRTSRHGGNVGKFTK